MADPGGFANKIAGVVIRKFLNKSLIAVRRNLLCGHVFETFLLEKKKNQLSNKKVPII